MCVVVSGFGQWVVCEKERGEKRTKRLFQNAARQSVLLCRFDSFEFLNFNFRFVQTFSRSTQTLESFIYAIIIIIQFYFLITRIYQQMITAYLKSTCLYFYISFASPVAPYTVWLVRKSNENLLDRITQVLNQLSETKYFHTIWQKP